MANLSKDDLRKIVSNFLGDTILSWAGDGAEPIFERVADAAFSSQAPVPMGWDPSYLARSVSDSEFVPADDRPKGKFYNPTSTFLNVDTSGSDTSTYREYPNRLTFETLRIMATQTPIITAILNTRINQVAQCARSPKDRWSPGYRIRPRDRNEKIGKEERTRIQEMEKFIAYTGVTKQPAKRDNFDTFLRKFARDSLTYDQAVAQLVPQRGATPENFIPAEFIAMDATTFRIAQFMNQDDDVLENGFVQMIEGQVVEHFERHEIIWGIRNPRTDIRVAGYGHSELEQMINVVTAILFAEEYNRRIFQTGSLPKGMLLAEAPPGAMTTGNVGFQEQLENFRRQWWAQVTGVQNAGKVPVIAGPAMKWVDLERGNRDMEWSAYHEMLIKLACAIYQIDPAEVNFDIRSMTSAPNALTQSSSEFAVKYSKDKGLIPLLHFIEDSINSHMIWTFDDNFVFEFVGIDEKTEQQAIDIRTKEVSAYKTLNEIRKEADLPSLGEKGDIVLNAMYTQHMSELEAQKQQEQQQQQGPPEGGFPSYGPWDEGDDSDLGPTEDEVANAPEAAPEEEGQPGQPPQKPGGKPKQPKPMQKSFKMKKLNANLILQPYGPFRRAHVEFRDPRWQG